MPEIVSVHVYCPFLSQLNPLVEEASEQTCAWLYQFGMFKNQTELERYRRNCVPYLAALAYPTCGLKELVQASKLLCWLLLADDLTENMADKSFATTVIDQCASVLTIERLRQVDTQDLLDPPLVLALQDLWQEIFPLVPLHWRRRFSRHMTDYFMAHAREIENCSQGAIPDLETYVRLRMDTGFTLPLFDLIEYVEHSFLPPSAALSFRPYVKPPETRSIGSMISTLGTKSIWHMIPTILLASCNTTNSLASQKRLQKLVRW
jgi:hypothetical protein